MNSPRPVRLLELDALRGLAALAVVLYHFTTRFDALYGPVEGRFLEVPLGHHGVEVFFMISGFVVFMTLRRVGDIREFVVSRFSRLFPAFWVAAITTFLVVAAFGLPGRETKLDDLILNLTMVPGLLGAALVDGVYWTLQVELLFYAALVVLFLVLRLRPVLAVIVAWLGARAGHLTLREIGFELPWILVELAVLVHIPFFAIGMLLYRIHAGEGAVRTNVFTIGAALVLVAFGQGSAAFFVALATTLALGAIVHRRMPWLASPALVFLGTISYSLYLLHQNIGYVVLRALQDEGVRPDLAVLLAVAVTLTAAAGLTFLVERPAMRGLRALHTHAGRRRIA